MSKKVWHEPSVARLQMKDATQGTGGRGFDVCGAGGPVVCSSPG